MKKIHLTALIAAVVSVVSIARAGTITEDFTANPLQNGWHVFGDTNLFHWNSTNHELEVTWDSSQSNSYFYRNLGNILARDDDFQISFDLEFSTIAAGVNPDKPDALEVGIGFFNFADATSTNFIRGFSPLNVAEFDYFPYFDDPIFGPVNPSVSPVIISSNYNYYGAFGYYFTMTNGVSYHVQTTYTSSNTTLVTTVTLTGQTNVLITAVTSPPVPGNDDFRVDTLSVSSYGDAGDAYDSLFAQGTVRNVVITIPPPPVQNLAIGLSNGVWQTQFTSRTNWLYTLQSAPDLQTWQNVSASAPGTGATLVLPDTNPPAARAFYRVSAARP